MAELNETPRGNRIRIAFFGLRNAGKSTLVNAFTGQPLAIVSDTPGTTTDPVSKAMEIAPLGPCLITDTAGLDDVGELGAQRVRKSLEVLNATDVAVWVSADSEPPPAAFVAACAARKVVRLDFHRGDSVAALKEKIAAVHVQETQPGLLDGLVTAGNRVLCIVPIDAAAPKGRLILPQQQVIRECLDRHATCVIAQPEDVPAGDYDLAITDSQAFAQVKGRFPRLTSFSVLFARQKGDLGEFVRGLKAIRTLKNGDTVVIAEGCTHHRQCDDIGSVKIPAALKKLSGADVKFVFVSGAAGELPPAALIVQCGGCMLTRREMLRRIDRARCSGTPIVNYGLVLAVASGMDVSDVLI